MAVITETQTARTAVSAKLSRVLKRMLDITIVKIDPSMIMGSTKLHWYTAKMVIEKYAAMSSIEDAFTNPFLERKSKVTKNPKIAANSFRGMPE